MFTVRYIVKWLQLPPIPDCIPLCSSFPSRDGRVYFFNSEFGLSVRLFSAKETLRSLMEAEAWKLLVLWAFPFLTAGSLFATTDKNPDQLPPRWKHTGQNTRGPEEAPTLSVLPTSPDMWVNYPCFSLFPAATMKYQRLSGFINNRHLFLTFLKTEKSKIKVLTDSVSAESLVHSHLLAMSSHSQWKEQGSSCGLKVKLFSSVRTLQPHGL